MATSGEHSPPYTPMVHYDDGEYWPYPYSVFHLKNPLYAGGIAVATAGTVSAVLCFILVGHLFVHFCAWKKHYNASVASKQYVVLLFNLILADRIQGAAFALGWHWIIKRAVLAPTAMCYAQGPPETLGIVAGGFFVLAIALYTYYAAVRGRPLGQGLFAGLVVGIWVAAAILCTIGFAFHGPALVTAAGAWCWISPAFQNARLLTEDLWLLITQFSTIILYAATFVHLRIRVHRSKITSDRGSLGAGIPFQRVSIPSANRGAAPVALTDRMIHQHSARLVNHIAKFMFLYPSIYVLLTLPITAGRLYSIANGGAPAGEVQICVAITMMTSCGWVNVILYTLTRKRLLLDVVPAHERRHHRPRLRPYRPGDEPRGKKHKIRIWWPSWIWWWKVDRSRPSSVNDDRPEPMPVFASTRRTSEGLPAIDKIVESARDDPRLSTCTTWSLADLARLERMIRAGSVPTINEAGGGSDRSGGGTRDS